MRIFSSSFIFDGITVTQNGSVANQVDMTAGQVYFYNVPSEGYSVFPPQSFQTTAPNSTYYLDLLPTGTVSFSTTRNNEAGYVEACTVQTDANGNVASVTTNSAAYTGNLFS